MRTFSSATKKNSRQSSTSTRRLISIVVVLVLGFCALTIARGGIGAAASYVFAPVVAMKTWFDASPATLPNYLRTQAALIAEVQTLEDALATHEDDALTIASLQEENELLSELLNIGEEGRITASVLLRPGQTPYDTFVIGKGSNDGVKKGATVYAHTTTAIGKVAAVYPSHALVRLVSAPGTQSTAFIFGPDIFTDAVGIGGGVLQVTVPQGVPLAVGDVVVLPGAGSGAYGEVVEVAALESSPNQYGYVTSPVTLQSARFVQVSTRVVPQISYEDAQAVVESASSTLFGIEVPEDVLVGTTTAATADDN